MRWERSVIGSAEASAEVGSPVELYQRAVPFTQTASAELEMTVSKVLDSLEVAEEALAETER